MKKNDYLLYNCYLKKRKIVDQKILITKTRNSYIIGPLIDSFFDEYSFYKRIMSNCIYSQKIYKRVPKKKCLYLINKFSKQLKNNEVMEVFEDESYNIYHVIAVPRV